MRRSTVKSSKLTKLAKKKKLYCTARSQYLCYRDLTLHKIFRSLPLLQKHEFRQLRALLFPLYVVIKCRWLTPAPLAAAAGSVRSKLVLARVARRHRRLQQAARRVVGFFFWFFLNLLPLFELGEEEKRGGVRPSMPG